MKYYFILAVSSDILITEMISEVKWVYYFFNEKRNVIFPGNPRIINIYERVLIIYDAKELAYEYIALPFLECNACLSGCPVTQQILSHLLQKALRLILIYSGINLHDISEYLPVVLPPCAAGLSGSLFTLVLVYNTYTPNGTNTPFLKYTP